MYDKKSWHCLSARARFLQGVIWACILGISPHSYTRATVYVDYNAIMQESWSQCWSVSSSDTACLSVSHSLTLSACLSALTLSVIAGCVPCLSVWWSICSIRQSIPFVFDSWRVILSVCLSDVIQVHCARAESPGVTISFFFYLALSLPCPLSPDTFQSGLSGDACTRAR